MMNPATLFKVKSAWEKFAANHPKFPMFINAVSRTGINAGDVVELKITKEDGDVLCTNVKLTADDMELFAILSEVGKSAK
jgi:hypothetical protein